MSEDDEGGEKGKSEPKREKVDEVPLGIRKPKAPKFDSAHFVEKQRRLDEEEEHEMDRKVSDGDLGMHVVFRVRGEEAHLPVALASMAAKYLRELLMLRFRAFWLDLAPGVKPTYGYLPDGRRFIGEIEPLITRLGIRRESLIRNR